MNNAILGKTVENVRQHRNNKLVANSRSKNHLVSESNYHTTEQFPILTIDMNKTKVQMNKSVYLGLSILDVSKIAMYEYLSNGMTK